jgi:hypothetical protein
VAYEAAVEAIGKDVVAKAPEYSKLLKRLHQRVHKL